MADCGVPGCTVAAAWGSGHTADIVPERSHPRPSCSLSHRIPCLLRTYLQKLTDMRERAETEKQRPAIPAVCPAARSTPLRPLGNNERSEISLDINCAHRASSTGYMMLLLLLPLLRRASSPCSSKQHLLYRRSHGSGIAEARVVKPDNTTLEPVGTSQRVVVLAVNELLPGLPRSHDTGHIVQPNGWTWTRRYDTEPCLWEVVRMASVIAEQRCTWWNDK